MNRHCWEERLSRLSGSVRRQSSGCEVLGPGRVGEEVIPTGDSQWKPQREEERLSVWLGAEPGPAAASFKPVPVGQARSRARRLRRVDRRLLRGSLRT